jgi:hypothetical protein
MMNLLPWKSLHEARDTVNSLHTLANDVIEAKKSALRQGDYAVLEEIGEGKDILSVLRNQNFFFDIGWL